MSSMKDFQVLGAIGTGAFSSVHKVKRISDGQEYALKKVRLPNLKSKEKDNALNEIRILASIEHENIIGYKQAFYEENVSSLCIVMEYASGGDLYQLLTAHKKKGTRIPEEVIWSYLIQMVQGLKTLHDMKILHRDLKSANVFLTADKKVAKLGDLNVSKITSQGLAYTQAGTPYYAAPEVWQEKPYGAKSDIWSLGCILYELCTFLPPFRAPSMSGLYQKILKGVYEKIPSTYSQDLAKIIGLCLNVQPTARPSCDQLLSNSLLVNKMTQSQLERVQSIPPMDLLDTIKMPRNLKKLTDMLPKPNYKPREVVSLADLDGPVRIDEDIRRKIQEPRPQTRLDRKDSDRTNRNNVNDINLKNDSKENSIDQVIRGREPKVPIVKKQHSVPPTLQQKKVEKLTPIQRTAKAILTDIFAKNEKLVMSSKVGSKVIANSSNKENEMLSQKGQNIFYDDRLSKKVPKPIY